MKIKYTCTYWGSENLSAKQFLQKALDHGYDGVEINFPDDSAFIEEFEAELKHIRATQNKDFIFIAQQVLPNKTETLDAYCNSIEERLSMLCKLKPNFINSHT